MASFSAFAVVGFAAAVMTLATFAQRSMLPMRVSAILANAFFIAYGWLGPLYPVLCLHLVLLPVNIYRLIDVAQPLRLRLSPRRGDYPPLIEEWHRGEVSAP